MTGYALYPYSVSSQNKGKSAYASLYTCKTDCALASTAGI